MTPKLTPRPVTQPLAAAKDEGYYGSMDMQKQTRRRLGGEAAPVSDRHSLCGGGRGGGVLARIIPSPT